MFLKSLYAVALFSSFLSTSALAAVALESASAPVNGGAGVTTLGVTCAGTGATTGAAVTAYFFDGAGGTATATVSYGGTNMPISLRQPDAVGQNVGYIFGLASPPTGSQTATVTFSGTVFPIISCVTVTGSDAATVFSGAGASATSTGILVSVTVPSAVGELVLDLEGNDTNATITVTGSQTTYYLNQALGGLRSAAATSPGASPTVTPTYSNLGSNWVALGVSFKASSGVTPVTSRSLSGAGK